MRTATREVYMYLNDPAQMRKWMRHRGLSYAELGQAVGKSRQFIHQLATGQKRTCRPATARKIEKFLLPPAGERRPDDKPLFVQRASDQTGGSSELSAVSATT